MKYKLTVALCFMIFVAYTDSSAQTKYDIASQTYDNYLNLKHFDQFIDRTISLPGGYYETPYIADSPNTKYVIYDDIIAKGSAIQIKASNVIIDLNGKTITYNDMVPGDGISVGSWNEKNIAVVNGTIKQGVAMSEGDESGTGNNPVRAHPYAVDKLYIADLHIIYGAKDVGGIVTTATNSVFRNNIVEDQYSHGVLKNRHQGIDALTGTGGTSEITNNIYINNIIINCRHRGIAVGNNDTAVGNRIIVNSIATNSFGIYVYDKQNVKIFNNYITATGEHPIGIGAVAKGTDNIEIYNNTIDVQTTRLGTEYGSDPECQNHATPCGNYAVGFRTTWGGNNISFHDNEIIVRTDSSYKGTYSETAKPAVVNAKGRGLMVAVNVGESSKFFNNTITVLDKDGSGKAFGIACTGGNAGEMIFEGNTVASNILNVALGDEYGSCAGHPLFIRNTFIKVDDYRTYRTVASELGGWFEGTGRFVSNVYRGGALQESIDINVVSEGGAGKSVFFGRELLVQLQSLDGASLAGAHLKLRNGGDPFDATAISAGDGSARLVLYDYELHNRNSMTVQTNNLAPHVIDVTVGADTFTTKPDVSPLAWDDQKATGTYELLLYSDGAVEPAGKLMITYLNTEKEPE
jgi:hypothetical protein